MIRRRSETNSSFEMNYLKGFDVGITAFKFRQNGSGVKIVVDESSDRLQLLAPFETGWKKYYWC
jgi:hypothetical protein